MKRAVVFSLLVLAGCLCCAGFAAERPNIVLIYTDDQGYGDASCLNPESKFQTPNLDRLAREGITFTDAHCSDSVCTPSRYGLLTGRYNWRTRLKRGVFGAETPCLIADGRMTLASFLRDQGYKTAMVGKWHLGMDFPGDRNTRDWTQPVLDMPLDKGFDYYYGVPASLNYGVLAWFEGRYAAVPPTQYTEKKPNDIAIADYRIMPPYESAPGPLDLPDAEGNVRGMLEVAPDFVDIECLTRFTDKAIAWMKEQAASAQAGAPFFLYLPYTSPHKPVIPRPEFRGQGEAGAYGEFMIETDHHVGRILDFLAESGLDKSTMIVYTSDNGPETTWRDRIERYGHHSNGIYRDGKRSIYDGGHRLPFFVRWPGGVVAPGRAYGEPVCQTDLLATFVQLLGGNLPANAGEDSVSFAPVLFDADVKLERAPMVHHAMDGRFAVRQGQWKLILPKGNTGRELYDMAADPGETTNVLDAHPQIAERLEAAITEIVRNGRTTEGAAQPNDTGWWEDLTWMDPDRYASKK